MAPHCGAPTVGLLFGGEDVERMGRLELERRLLSRSFPSPGSVGTSLRNFSPPAHTWGHSQVTRLPAISGQVGCLQIMGEDHHPLGHREDHHRPWVSCGSRKPPHTSHPVWSGAAFGEQLEQKQRGGGDPHLLSTELGGRCSQELVSSYIVNSCRKFRESG